MSALPPLLNGARARAWAWWIVPAVALAAVIGWETDWGRQIIRVPPPAQLAEPKPIAAAVLPDYQIEGGLSAHAETVNRTLFNATRRPAPVLAGDDGPRNIRRGQFQLMGTAVTGERNVAFLKEVAGGKSKVVRQGEQINGMLVASIEPDRVKFTLGDESEELFLKVAPGPKTTIAAAPAAPGAAAAAAAAAAPAAARTVATGAPTAAAPAAPERSQSRQARRAARQAAGQGGAADASTGDASAQGANQGGGGGHGRARSK
jgi:two-component system chemotaxis sensor kinase CheA